MVVNSTSELDCERGVCFKILSIVVGLTVAISSSISVFGVAKVVDIQVIDEDKKYELSTPCLSTDCLFSSLNIAIGKTDIVDLSNFSYDNGGVILIKRNAKKIYRVEIVCDGVGRIIECEETTVNDAINQAGVKISDDDITNPSRDFKITSDLTVRVLRVVHKTRIINEQVNYKHLSAKSDKLAIDETQLFQKGKNGRKEVEYDLKYIDGKLVSTSILGENLIDEPIEEIIENGTVKVDRLSAYKNSEYAISDLIMPDYVQINKDKAPVSYKQLIKGKATAYTGDQYTSTGRVPMPGHIAVNPKQIPYGSELYVTSADGKYIYGYCIAADTGGFVKMGNTTIDLYMNTESMCYAWGNRRVNIYILSYGK